MGRLSDLPLLKRACRARRQEDGEEERRLHQRRRKSRGQGSQHRKLRRQDAACLCQDMECCTGRRSSGCAKTYEIVTKRYAIRIRTLNPISFFSTITFCFGHARPTPLYSCAGYREDDGQILRTGVGRSISQYDIRTVTLAATRSVYLHAVFSSRTMKI